MSVIQAENLTKTYVTHRRGATFGAAVKSLFHREKVLIHAVNDISFEINPGEIVGILGKNGAGKSTVIKMMTGVLYPTSGSIRVMGYEPTRQRSRYVAHIGAVFGQKSQLIWDIPPADSFAMNRAIYAIEPVRYKNNLERMIELFGLSEVISRPTRVLSLGERMKCEFVMAMLHNPQVVFLDEPTIGLDLLAKEAIREFILQMNQEGITFILTTHDFDDVERLASRVLVINNGVKVFDNRMQALKMHLGNKHILRISARTPLAGLDWSWSNVLQKTSDCEMELLVDNDQLPLDEMMAKISSIPGIVDIGIQSLPVEQIVRELYKL